LAEVNKEEAFMSLLSPHMSGIIAPSFHPVLRPPRQFFRDSINGNRPVQHRGFKRNRFAVNVAATTDLVAAAVNANSTVLSYVNALTNSPLPQLPGTPPSWWTTFVDAYPAVQANALEWVNSVSPNLTSIPQSIINYNALFQQNVNYANQYVSGLIQNPNDQAYQTSLANVLTMLSTSVVGQQTTASGFMTMIDTFASNLSSDQTTLTNAVNSAAGTIGVDDQQIQKLNNDIQALQSEIATWNQYVLASQIGLVVSIFVSIVGVIIAFASFGFGAVLVGVGLLGVGASIAGWVVYEKKVQTAQQQVNTDAANLNTLTQQAAVLTTMNSSLSNIITLSQAAQQTVESIVTQWQTLQNDISSVVTDITNAQSDLTSADYSQLQSELEDASNDWATLQSAAQGLADITYTVSNTPVSIPAN
jgi:non-hemolytic enterotoxin B/C